MDGPDPVGRVAVPVSTRAPGGETNAYLADGLLVDPAARSDALDAAVAAASVDHVAVTHAHPDHVGAVASYADETGATVWAHADHVDRFADATGVTPDRTFADGDAVGPARALSTPGHAPDHACFRLDGGSGTPAAVLCGDLAVAEGSVVVGWPEGDVAAYLDSLARLRGTAPARTYPGHGPPIDDPAAAADRLVAHRRERERRVYDAVADGATDVDAVLDAAYGKDLTGVADLARATVVAHLVKLAADGRVAFEPGSPAVALPDGDGDGDGNGDAGTDGDGDDGDRRA